MGSSVVPLQKGFLYQAYCFWIHAAELFARASKVKQIAYEINGSKAFDDVQVHYAEPLRGERGESVSQDLYQIKFHIDLSGSVGYEDLIEPSFIGATSISFLQRLKKLYDADPAISARTRFYLFTNWPIKTSDPLAEIVSGNGGEIRIDKLENAGGPRSKLGKLKESWKTHLNFASDEDLYKLISSVRLCCGSPNMEQMKQALNNRLAPLGFAPIDLSLGGEPYSSLIFRLCGEGRAMFSRDELLEELKREKLIVDLPIQEVVNRRLGVRSFYRFAEKLENETESMVPLERYFDARFVRDPLYWNGEIKNELMAFVSSNLAHGSKPADIYLETHGSIAFAFGSLLDPKVGIDIGVFQRGAKGQEIWRMSKQGARPNTLLSVSGESQLTAADVAVVVSITRDAKSDVEAYIKNELQNVQQIVEIKPEGGVGQTVIQDADHAWKMSESISEQLRTIRSKIGVSPVIHLFLTAPNSISFFAGRLSSAAGKIKLYEYDFEKKKHGTYEASVSLPWEG